MIAAVGYWDGVAPSHARHASPSRGSGPRQGEEIDACIAGTRREQARGEAKAE